MKLRHIQLIFLLVLTMHSAVFAQDIRFGVQAGGGVASAYNFYPERNEYVDDAVPGIPKNYIVPSYGLNLYFSIPLDSEFAIAVEPGIIQKGYSNRIFAENDLFHNNYFFTYFQAPILLEYRFSESPISLTAGPDLGYLISARRKSNDGTNETTTHRQRNKFDAGVQFGIFYTHAERFDLGLKLGGSITNLDKIYLLNVDREVLGSVGKKASCFHAFVRVKF